MAIKQFFTSLIIFNAGNGKYQCKQADFHHRQPPDYNNIWWHRICVKTWRLLLM